MTEPLEKIIRSAAQIMLSMQPQGISSKEGHANFVTEADKKTQDYLREQLLTLLPGSLLYAKEKENEALSDAPTWVVDPIDGTLNYIHSLGHSAISIALAQGRQVQLAAVYNPYRDELFTAQRGKGALLNGQPIHCSDTPFERALSFYGTSPYKPGLAKATWRAVEQLLAQTADLRRFGSAALDLCYVACGRADLYFEYSLSPWDYAAGLLLVQEAGGVVQLLNLPNDQLDFSAPAALLAANPACAQQALAIVEGAYRNCQV